MANHDDDDDWEVWPDLDVEPVPFETPPLEPAVPVAFRAYFADIESEGFYRGQVGPFTRKMCWWLMAKRLEAFERLRTSDLDTTVRPSYVEWRVRVA